MVCDIAIRNREMRGIGNSDHHMKEASLKRENLTEKKSSVDYSNMFVQQERIETSEIKEDDTFWQGCICLIVMREGLKRNVI